MKMMNPTPWTFASTIVAMSKVGYRVMPVSCGSIINVKAWTPGLGPFDGYGDGDSYKCISCSRDEDLMHSLGDMDKQRGDETRTGINDGEVEILRF